MKFERDVVFPNTEVAKAGDSPDIMGKGWSERSGIFASGVRINDRPLVVVASQWNVYLLSEAISQLGRRVSRVESSASARVQGIDAIEVLVAREKVEKITRDLFPGDVDVDIQEDPDVSGERYLVFNVRASGAIDDLAKIQQDWHSSVAELPANTRRLFRLSLDVI